MMKQFLILPVVLLSSIPTYSQEVYRININRVCAAIVNIAYASDNFTNDEWKQFKDCLTFMRQFKQ